MQPCFIIVNGSIEHDYTAYVDWDDGLQPTRNDIDAEGAGRNLLDGLMHRSLLTRKAKITVKFLPLPDHVIKAISNDLGASEFVDIKYLDPGLNDYVTRTMYTSALSYGTQRYNRSAQATRYHGCTFSLTER